MADAYEFFYEHAGWSYDPKSETKKQGRQRCAAGLARAEAWARSSGTFYNWERDYETNGETEWQCSMFKHLSTPGTDPELVGHLGGIDLGTESPVDYRPGHRCTYARVVEAELALEAMTLRPAKTYEPTVPKVTDTQKWPGNDPAWKP